ncbi:MAG: hypothetical protein ACJ78T_07205 [Myxococcales bacterium]
MVALALLLVAAMPPFRPDAQQLFDGCVAGRNGPSGRLYGCKDWNSSITALPGVRKPGDAIEYARSGFRTTLKGKLREEEVPLAVGGRQRPVLLVTPADPAASGFFGFAEALVLPTERGLRLVTCASRTDGKLERDRCRKAFDYFAGRGTPDGIVID